MTQRAAQKSFFWNNPDIIEIPPTDAAKIKYVLMNVNGKARNPKQNDMIQNRVETK